MRYVEAHCKWVQPEWRADYMSRCYLFNVSFNGKEIICVYLFLYDIYYVGSVVTDAWCLAQLWLLMPGA